MDEREKIENEDPDGGSDNNDADIEELRKLIMSGTGKKREKRLAAMKAQQALEAAPEPPSVIPEPDAEAVIPDSDIDMDINVDDIIAGAQPAKETPDDTAEGTPAEEEAPGIMPDIILPGVYGEIEEEKQPEPEEEEEITEYPDESDEYYDNIPDEEMTDEEYADSFDYSDMYRELERSRRKKRRSKNKGKLVFGLILTMFIICISIFIAVFVIRAARDITGIDRDEGQVVIEIPENSTAADIAAILYEEGVIGDEKLFIMFSRTKDADAGYIAGSHVLSRNMPYDAIIEALQRTEETEERETIDVTFPEGISLYDAARKLEESGVCEADRFIYIFNSSSFGFDFEKKVSPSPDKFCKMEGYFFPDTYSFYIDEEPEAVTKKIYRNFENKITPDLYGRMSDLGLSLEDTITLASMIQAEGNNPRDMKKISSVFHNRLKSKDLPKLQSDPTTKYVEEVIKPNIEVPNEKMYTDYDTYKSEGLPPGAICNPGIDAIKAALYPDETNYYYFCANIDTGEVFYAETLEEHEDNLIEAGIVKGTPKNEKKKKKKSGENAEGADDTASGETEE